MVIITRSLRKNIKSQQTCHLLASKGGEIRYFAQCLESHVHLDRDGPGLSSFGSNSFYLPSMGKPFFYLLFRCWTLLFCHN